MKYKIQLFSIINTCYNKIGKTITDKIKVGNTSNKSRLIAEIIYHANINIE